MAQSQFSLFWNGHKKNICSGLSSLQQNGEFVDMTLAADGHLVKVHQLIMALASPYIKELISSAQCPHPVIFLNKISYTTLCSILEYVYTGEVLVSIDNLSELIEAGKELHIKGLEDMKLAMSTNVNQQISRTNVIEDDCHMESLDDDISYFEITNKNDEVDAKYVINSVDCNDGPRILSSSTVDATFVDEHKGDEECIIEDIAKYERQNENKQTDDSNVSVMQFTVSNQGSLQMILNRYVYYLKHTNKNSTRQWRCVDYLNNAKCPAHVFTKDDVVVQRIAAHVHPFHDKRILKKVRAGAVFSAIHEAEQQRNKQNDANNSE